MTEEREPRDTSSARDADRSPLSVDGVLPLGPLLHRAYRWYQDAMASALAGSGEAQIGIGQARVFIELDQNGATIAELARLCGATRQSMHQSVHALVDAGLLRVERNPASHRSALVLPTAEGMARMRRAGQLLHRIDDDLAERIGGVAIQVLRAALTVDWGPPPAVASDGNVK